MKPTERFDIENDFKGLLLFQRTEFLAKKLTHPHPLPKYTRGTLSDWIIAGLQAVLDVKLHIMRVSEVLCEPDTFENLRALPGIRFLCRRASFFTKLLWKLIYERNSGKKTE